MAVYVKDAHSAAHEKCGGDIPVFTPAVPMLPMPPLLEAFFGWSKDSPPLFIFYGRDAKMVTRSGHCCAIWPDTLHERMRLAKVLGLQEVRDAVHQALTQIGISS